VKKLLLAAAALIALSVSTQAMVVKTNATGPYNYTCEEFTKAGPHERALALVVRAGLLCCSQYECPVGCPPGNLQKRWRELDASRGRLKR
jgi:hypothetical protein